MFQQLWTGLSNQQAWTALLQQRCSNLLVQQSCYLEPVKPTGLFSPVIFFTYSSRERRPKKLKCVRGNYFSVKHAVNDIHAHFSLHNLVNTKAAEILYKTVQEWSEVTSKTLILVIFFFVALLLLANFRTKSENV